MSTPREGDTGFTLSFNRFVGLVVKESASRAEDPACAEIFPRSSHANDFKIATPVATLPGARYRVRTGTGRFGVSIL